MPKSQLQIQTPEEAETVFYKAFSYGDKEVMAALWAEGDVVCMHPGSGIILGHDAVVRSWNHILENSLRSEIRYRVSNKTVSDELAIHVVTEELLDDSTLLAVVIATNVYQKFEQGWLMVEHHGSVMQQEHASHTLQ